MIELANGKKVKEPKSKTWIYVLILLLLLIPSIYITDALTGFAKMIDNFDNGIEFFQKFFDIANYDFTYLKVISKPLLNTISMSILGSVLGMIVSLPVALFCSSNINKSKSLWVVRILLNIIRTIPVIVLALIFAYIYVDGAFAGFLAIFVFTFSISVKTLYEYIETINMDTYEAMIANGMSKFSAIRYTILPELKIYFISTGLYNFEVNIRNASILGYVGAGGIGILLDNALKQREYGEAGLTFICLLVFVLIIEAISKEVRKRLG